LPKLCWRFVDILPQLPKPILNKGEITQTKLNWKPARRDRKNALVSTGCTAEPEKRLFVFAFVVLNLTPFFPQLTFYFAFSIATPVHIFFLSPLNVFTRQKYFFHSNLAFSACVRLFATINTYLLPYYENKVQRNLYVPFLLNFFHTKEIRLNDFIKKPCCLFHLLDSSIDGFKT